MRFRRHWALLLALASAACAGREHAPVLAGDATAAATGSPATIAVTPYGAYLAGRVAQEDHDYPAALAFYQSALAHAPGNLEISNRLFVLAITEGRFDLARPLAATLLEHDPQAALPNLIETAEELKRDAPRDALAHANKIEREGYFRLCGALARAWATLAATGQLPAATAALDDLGDEAPLQALKTLQKALMADLAGDTAAAADAYRQAVGNAPPPLRLTQLAGNFFERTGQRDAAASLYHAYGTSAHGEIEAEPELSPPGKPPARIIGGAADGFAEAMFDLASLLSQAGSPDVAILNARLALELRPDAALTRLVLADALEAENRPRAALQIYREVETAPALGWTARLREAEIADTLNDAAGAEKTLQAMSAERPGQAEAPLALGAIYREHDDYKAAIDAYTEGLKRLGADPPAQFWSVYYSRGIAEEESNEWPAAETDLHHALALNPDNADVMNYLGYSLVERNQDLPEALKLIQRAVELQPENGYIVDSLGWAYFRAGKMADAERTLEKAVELKPGDAEINDHLGDAYWQGGRQDEARLQWKRALSLKPTPGVAQKIEAKLDRPASDPHRLKTARERE
jgi:tetratricopeptide (TPR) repeat protein